MIMKQLMEPEIEIVKFSVLDIITSSTEREYYDDLGWDIEDP